MPCAGNCLPAHGTKAKQLQTAKNFIFHIQDAMRQTVLKLKSKNKIYFFDFNGSNKKTSWDKTKGIISSSILCRPCGYKNKSENITNKSL